MVIVVIHMVFNVDWIDVYNRINVDIVVNIMDVVGSGNRINVNVVLSVGGISSWVFNMDGSNNFVVSSWVVNLSVNVDISVYVFNNFMNYR